MRAGPERKVEMATHLREKDTIEPLEYIYDIGINAWRPRHGNPSDMPKEHTLGPDALTDSVKGELK